MSVSCRFQLLPFVTRISTGMMYSSFLSLKSLKLNNLKWKHLMKHDTKWIGFSWIWSTNKCFQLINHIAYYSLTRVHNSGMYDIIKNTYKSLEPKTDTAGEFKNTTCSSISKIIYIDILHLYNSYHHLKFKVYSHWERIFK